MVPAQDLVGIGEPPDRLSGKATMLRHPPDTDDGGAMTLPPYKIKVVEPIALAAASSASPHSRAAGWNTFLLRAEDVYVDLLTDSGTGALSQEQRAAMELGDEFYAGSEALPPRGGRARKYGYRHVIPPHQGRGAEHLLSRILVRPGQIVASNLYFTTSREHVELAGGIWADVSIPEASIRRRRTRSRGTSTSSKLEHVLSAAPPRASRSCASKARLNMAGGQPVSLENLRAVGGSAGRTGSR